MLCNCSLTRQLAMTPEKTNYITAGPDGKRKLAQDLTYHRTGDCKSLTCVSSVSRLAQPPATCCDDACAYVTSSHVGEDAETNEGDGKVVKRVFITNVKGTFLGMSESEEASKRR